jgi:hypothetical protein
MDFKRQFSLAVLFIEFFWIAGGFGFATAILHPAVPIEGNFLSIPLAFVCWGIAVGGLFNNPVDGAKGGLVVGFLLLIAALPFIGPTV